MKDCTKFIQKSAKSKDVLDEISMEVIPEDDPVFLLADTRTVSFESPDQVLKGMVLLEGCSVTEAEIAIKFPKWHKGQVYRTHIRSNSPWSLSQLRDVLLLCRTVSQMLHRWSAHSVNSSESDVLVKEFNELLSFLVQAKDQLLFPSATSVPKSGQGSQIFSPPLPSDVLVDIKIKNRELVITAAVLKAIAKPLSPSASGNKTFFSRKQNQHFEILDKASIELPVQKFDTLSKFIQGSIEAVEEFLSKLSVLVHV
jgi:hypothetical protein